MFFESCLCFCVISFLNTFWIYSIVLLLKFSEHIRVVHIICYFIGYCSVIARNARKVPLVGWLLVMLQLSNVRIPAGQAFGCDLWAEGVRCRERRREAPQAQQRHTGRQEGELKDEHWNPCICSYKKAGDYIWPFYVATHTATRIR